VMKCHLGELSQRCTQSRPAVVPRSREKGRLTHRRRCRTGRCGRPGHLCVVSVLRPPRHLCPVPPAVHDNAPARLPFLPLYPPPPLPCPFCWCAKVGGSHGSGKPPAFPSPPPHTFCRSRTCLRRVGRRCAPPHPFPNPSHLLLTALGSAAGVAPTSLPVTRLHRATALLAPSRGGVPPLPLLHLPALVARRTRLGCRRGSGALSLLPSGTFPAFCWSLSVRRRAGRRLLSSPLLRPGPLQWPVGRRPGSPPLLSASLTADVAAAGPSPSSGERPRDWRGDGCPPPAYRHPREAGGAAAILVWVRGAPCSSPYPPVVPPWMTGHLLGAPRWRL